MDRVELEAFLNAERERQKTPRERVIEGSIREIGERHQRAYQAEIAPLIAELIELNNLKAPLAIMEKS